jgi:hypothetical protein
VLHIVEEGLGGELGSHDEGCVAVVLFSGGGLVLESEDVLIWSGIVSKRRGRGKKK